jgi:hypothetical protein
VYLPRMAAGLAVGPEVSEFFIEFSLGWSSEPRADDMDKTVCFIMNHKQQAVFRGHADIDESFVSRSRVSRIRHRYHRAIKETGDSFVEGYPVFTEVDGCFAWVVFEADICHEG